MAGTKRLFCAVKVPLTEGIEEAFDVYRQELAGEAIKWVEPHNLHLTLKFFGDTPADHVGDILAALQSAARRTFHTGPAEKGSAARDASLAQPQPAATAPVAQPTAGLHFLIRGCGSFGPKGQPRVIWMGVEQAGALKQLSRTIDQELLPLGYEPDKKGFKPHLTLGRIKSLRDLQTLRDLEEEFSGTLFAEVKARSFFLMESTLTPKGPVYQVVDEIKI